MTQQGRKNCEAVGKRVYEMITDLCGQKSSARAFVSQKCNLDFGKGKVSLTLIIAKPNAWEMFQEFAKERGFDEVQPAERA